MGVQSINVTSHGEKNMPKYNHAFDIAFSIETDNEGENVTADELREGLRKRLDGISDAELIESCGLPWNTYEIEED